MDIQKAFKSGGSVVVTIKQGNGIEEGDYLFVDYQKDKVVIKKIKNVKGLK